MSETESFSDRSVREQTEKKAAVVRQKWAEAVGADPDDLDDWAVDRINDLEIAEKCLEQEIEGLQEQVEDLTREMSRLREMIGEDDD